jgi:APA family basic amino acid/polyamine antiporter
MAKDGVFKKAAVLNKASVPSWALWAQCFWASALCLTGKYGDLLDFVVIIVLIFYILTILEYSSFVERCQMLKDLIRLLLPVFARTIYRCGYCYLRCFVFTKTSTSGWVC